jgi:hypothetical protein
LRQGTLHNGWLLLLLLPPSTVSSQQLEHDVRGA